jgi:hypothetical protein
MDDVSRDLKELLPCARKNVKDAVWLESNAPPQFEGKAMGHRIGCEMIEEAIRERIESDTEGARRLLEVGLLLTEIPL